MRSRRVLCVLLASSGVLPASLAAADTVEATATTFVTLRREARDGDLSTVVPVYELISVRARDLENKLLDRTEIVLSLWGRGTGGEPRDDHSFTGDVDLGYVKGSLGRGRVTLRAGRQFIAGGVARNVQADGLEVDARIVRGLGVSAFGGAPVTPRFGVKSGDLLGGGRVYWQRSWQSAVGVSFIRVLDDKFLARQDVGFDAWQALPHGLDVGGFALWSLIEERLAEADLSLGWTGRRHGLRVSADARRTAPDLFLSRTSILSVFSEEKHDDAGFTVSLRPMPVLRLRGQYHFVATEKGDGHRASARAVLGLGASGLASVGLEARYLDVPDAGYLDARLFASVRPTLRLTFTADADVVSFLEDVNGHDRSILAGLTAGYAFAPGWQAMLAATGGQTPFYERRFEGTIRIGYAFGGGR